MSKTFLTAAWQNLLMANYEVDPVILKKHLPACTELDTFNNTHYISLVGFLFKDTKVKGLSFPFHRNFEEVNLRFYVRRKENGQWKRGVVFIKEIVPRRMITFIANTLYKENYATHKMKHTWQFTEKSFHVEYNWKAYAQWNHFSASADTTAQPIDEGSEAEFITEHYWGYTLLNQKTTGEYEVSHPRWRTYHVKEYDIKCNVAALYGTEFVDAFTQVPKSVFMAEGSPIKVMKGKQISIN